MSISISNKSLSSDFNTSNINTNKKITTLKDLKLNGKYISRIYWCNNYFFSNLPNKCGLIYKRQHQWTLINKLNLPYKQPVAVSGPSSYKYIDIGMDKIGPFKKDTKIYVSCNDLDNDLIVWSGGPMIAYTDYRIGTYSAGKIVTDGENYWKLTSNFIFDGSNRPPESDKITITKIESGKTYKAGTYISIYDFQGPIWLLTEDLTYNGEYYWDVIPYDPICYLSDDFYGDSGIFIKKYDVGDMSFVYSSAFENKYWQWFEQHDQQEYPGNFNDDQIRAILAENGLTTYYNNMSHDHRAYGNWTGNYINSTYEYLCTVPANTVIGIRLFDEGIRYGFDGMIKCGEDEDIITTIDFTIFKTTECNKYQFKLIIINMKTKQKTEEQYDYNTLPNLLEMQIGYEYQFYIKHK